MMKKFILLAIGLGVNVSAQVGVNTTFPKSTFDVNAKRDTLGIITDPSQIIGLQSPRITRAELTSSTAIYGADQKGALVYITDISAGNTSGQRININNIGYYYFDGVLWQKFNNDNLNIYNADGSLTDYRVLSLNTHPLVFEGVGQSTMFSDNAFNLFGTPRASLTLDAADNDGNVSQLSIYVDSENAAQILSYSDATSLILGTHSTKVSAPIQFTTSSGQFNLGQLRAEIAGDGKFNIMNTLSVGYDYQQDFAGTIKLKINGGITTATEVYPDYVFENYVNGSSSLKPNYKLSSIYDTENFIIQNKHLPGVTPISALEKTENGYSFNITDLSIQSLEKLEELYLHVINQQKQIDEQQIKIDTLIKLINQRE